MTGQNLTPIRIDALKVLMATAISHLDNCPAAEQIKIYQVLAEALPDERQRLRARELARVLSRVDALQLEFREGMTGEYKF